MAFGVFIHREDSIYDDSPAEQYQFPSQYLRRVQECVGDWVVYYEPVKVAQTKGYFAVAKVQEVIRDPSAEGMYLAVIEPGSYLGFVNPVPFSGPDGVIERGVLNSKGRLSGRAQSAVRPLSGEDFSRIVQKGWTTPNRCCRALVTWRSALGLRKLHPTFGWSRSACESVRLSRASFVTVFSERSSCVPMMSDARSPV